MVGKLQIEISLVFFKFSLLCFFAACSQGKNTTDFFYSSDSIQSGDIILRKGYGLVSEVVVYQMKDTIDVSHCGIVVTNKKGGFDVIHSLSKTVSDYDGVQLTSLKEFVGDSKLETMRVFRYKNDQQGLIEQYAHHYLLQQRAFDERFDMLDSTSFSCLELPIHIIKLVDKKDLSQGNPRPLFSLFLDPNNFKEIAFVHRKSHSYK